MDRWSIVVDSELQVVRYDPEAADMDHPRGEVVGEVFFLQATNSRGDRKVYGEGWFTAEAAEAAIPFAPPVFLWNDGRPEYGSQAYLEYGADDDLESERRFNEAESWGFDTRFMIF